MLDQVADCGDAFHTARTPREVSSLGRAAACSFEGRTSWIGFPDAS
jgi:hypothetical protein